MINNEKILRAIWSASDEKVAESETSKIMKKYVHKKWFILAAACAVFATIGIFALIQPDSNIVSLPPIDPGNIDIIGLPIVENEPCPGGVSISADRVAFNNMQSLVSTAHAFVFARVNEQTQPRNEDRNWLIQNSTLQILSEVWVSGEGVPQFIDVTQVFFDNRSGSMVCCTGPIPLRHGGVYFLPLRNDGVSWRIVGAEDVLFEVDDQGNIFSHSTFDAFNRFDGATATMLSDTVLALIEDDDFAIATGTFGRIFQWDYEVRVVVYNETPGITFETASGSHIFEPGGKYLAIITEDNTVWNFYTTHINPDGTITPDAASVFAELYGFTTDEVIEIAKRARAWHLK